MAVTHPSHSCATITIGDLKIKAFSTLAGISTNTDGVSGMPVMGQNLTTFEFSLDISDKTIPFDTIKRLFHLCWLPTREDTKEIRIVFHRDENDDDAILTLSFNGWVSSWTVSSGTGSNTVLAITLQPALNKQHYMDMQIGN